MISNRLLQESLEDFKEIDASAYGIVRPELYLCSRS